MEAFSGWHRGGVGRAGRGDSRAKAQRAQRGRENEQPNIRTFEQPNYEVGIRLHSCGSFAEIRRRAGCYSGIREADHHLEHNTAHRSTLAVSGCSGLDSMGRIIISHICQSGGSTGLSCTLMSGF